MAATRDVYIERIQRAIKSCQDEDGNQYLTGQFERLLRLTDPTFEYIVAPKDRILLTRIFDELRAARMDLVYCFTTVSRYHWQQSMLEISYSGTPRELEGHMLLRAFIESDIGNFHSYIRSIADYLATAVLLTIANPPATKNQFMDLCNRIGLNHESIPGNLRQVSPFGDVFLDFKNFYTHINWIRNEIIHKGANEIANSDNGWRAHFQVLDTNQRGLLKSDSMEIPDELIDRWIEVESYYGACLGRLVTFMNDFAYFFLEYLRETGQITPIAVLDIRDPRTYDVLVERGVSEEGLRRFKGIQGGGKVTINQNPGHIEHWVIGTPSAVQCLERALVRLGETPEPLRLRPLLLSEETNFDCPFCRAKLVRETYGENGSYIGVRCPGDDAHPESKGMCVYCGKNSLIMSNGVTFCDSTDCPSRKPRKAQGNDEPQA